MAYNKTRYSVSAHTKWYSIKKEDWRKFVDDVLWNIPRYDEYTKLNDEQKALWEAYFICKEHGKNDKGLFQLPYKRWYDGQRAIGNVE